jgi:hypothetical protein
MRRRSPKKKVEALAKAATSLDAFMMASAAIRGDMSSTPIEDLEQLRAFFPEMRLLSA